MIKLQEQHNEVVEFEVEYSPKLCSKCQIRVFCKFFEPLTSIAQRFVASSLSVQSNETEAIIDSFAENCIGYMEETTNGNNK